MSTIQQGSAGGVPVLILKEGSTQTKGRDAQKNNITAAKLIAEIVRSSLGPRGMDKMLVDTLGDVTITNDGATILKEIDVQHPAAKMMVEVAKSVDNEVGDGTTSSVVLAGALIEKAEELINKEVHPTIIVDGYQKASEKALDILKEDNAKIALLNCPLEIEKTEMSAEIRINQPQQMQRFLDEENSMLKSMVNKIKSSGANVVLCQKGIDDMAQHYLAKEEILAVRRIKESDMTKLSKATGAKMITNTNELSSTDLGSADLVEECKIETDKWVFIEGCKN